MKKHTDHHTDIIDEDLYEELDEEELLELVEKARLEALEKSRKREEERRNRRPFPKWLAWLIAFTMVLNLIAILPQTLSIPAVDFLITSAKLSQDKAIRTYKEAVVVVQTEDSKGTGFSINQSGDIVTNDHVIEGYDKVTIAFPKHGLYVGTVTERYPEVDLAVVTIEHDEDMPYLTIADHFDGDLDKSIYFIGNPLQFNGIANEGSIIDWIHVSSKLEPVVMLDAPVYRGNSGSPVIDEEGEVIGIVFATLDHDEYDRVGLFLPVDYLHERR